MSQIFRQKSIEQAASPDRLDEYIHVSNPSVWMVLAAIVLLIAGAAIWACFASLSDVQPATLQVSNGTATCYMDQSSAADLSTGDAIDMSGTQGTVASVSQYAMPYAELPTNVRTQTAEGTGWFYTASVTIDLPDGVYGAEVTTNSYSPIALLFGQE